MKQHFQQQQQKTILSAEDITFFSIFSSDTVFQRNICIHWDWKNKLPNIRINNFMESAKREDERSIAASRFLSFKGAFNENKEFTDEGGGAFNDTSS